jgi:RNA polymerase sigma-54 factor
MAIQAKQTIQQRLVLAPNVALALEILRMPTMELRAFLERQLEDNPLLELEESDAEEPSPELELEANREELPPTDLSEDWLSHWRTGAERESAQPDDAEEEERLIDQRMISSPSLYDSLRVQLGCQPLSEEELRLGETLIHHLDEYGYLESPLEELAAQLRVSVERLESVLQVIQRLDPAGVGARNLRECLMLQLEQRQERDSLPYRILQHHFELFMHNQQGPLARALGAAAQQIAEACDALRHLNPRPGRAFAADLPPSIVPDLVIRHREKHYDVELNDQDLPRVNVSRSYQRMLKDPRTPEDAKAFLLGKFRKAHWLIRAIDERNTTLLAIARCLISLQRAFLEQGPRALKPLTQAQVAALIGRHPSTVSRAITGKTIDTPYGVFRLEQLFASNIPQLDRTDGVSDEQIKSELQRLIAEEDPAHPLSDAALARELARRNLTVARRTIAKYRAELKMLPTHLRRRRA